MAKKKDNTKDVEKFIGDYESSGRQYSEPNLMSDYEQANLPAMVRMAKPNASQAAPTEEYKRFEGSDKKPQMARSSDPATQAKIDKALEAAELRTKAYDAENKRRVKVGNKKKVDVKKQEQFIHKLKQIAAGKVEEPKKRKVTVKTKK